jgi:hypothetical protein
MAGRFGDAALAAFAQASRLLGWRPQDFWSATPAELAAAFAVPGPAGLDRAGLETIFGSDLGMRDDG